MLEIDNIIRNIREMRCQILAMQGNGPTAENKVRMEKLDDMAAEMEFKTRDLEFELTRE